VGTFAAGVGVFGLVYPAGVRGFVARWTTPAGLWSAAGLRLTFGIALWIAAPGSKTPLAFQVLAVIAIAAAVLLPLLGLERFKAIIAWWLRQPPVLQHTWLAASIAFGAFLLWSVLT
jgi:hypothetical protein